MLGGLNKKDYMEKCSEQCLAHGTLLQVFGAVTVAVVLLLLE